MHSSKSHTDQTECEKTLATSSRNTREMGAVPPNTVRKCIEIILYTISKSNVSPETRLSSFAKRQTRTISPAT